MNVLIVYAHPEQKSFNGAMKDLAVETLRGAGHDVAGSDLYAMRFHAVVGAEDFLGFLERCDGADESVPDGNARAGDRRRTGKVEARDLLIPPILDLVLRHAGDHERLGRTRVRARLRLYRGAQI
jgi:putative NADPH-quinone reductase